MLSRLSAKKSRTVWHRLDLPLRIVDSLRTCEDTACLDSTRHFKTGWHHAPRAQRGLKEHERFECLRTLWSAHVTIHTSHKFCSPCTIAMSVPLSPSPPSPALPRRRQTQSANVRRTSGEVHHQSGQFGAADGQREDHICEWSRIVTAMLVAMRNASSSHL